MSEFPKIGMRVVTTSHGANASWSGRVGVIVGFPSRGDVRVEIDSDGSDEGGLMTCGYNEITCQHHFESDDHLCCQHCGAWRLDL